MATKGPQDITFLFPQRLHELTEKKSIESSSILDAIDDSTLESVMVPATSHIDRALESAALLEQKPAFLDFLIEKAGYPIDTTSPVAGQYRAHFEKIIQENDGIFEKLFLKIKERLDLNPDAKSPDQKKRALAIKSAREAALVDLADTLKALGAYHADNSKYYFSENKLTKDLSSPFLKALYGDPARAQAMLQSQKEKTEGQYEGKLAYIRENLLPGTYYGEVKDLAPLKEDFDLFLISPTVAKLLDSIEKGKKVGTAPSLYDSRADLLEGVHDTLHRVHRSARGRGKNWLAWLKQAPERPTNLTDYPDFTETLTEAFGRLTVEDRPVQPRAFVDAEIAQFNSLLGKYNFDFEIYNNLNAAERVFFFKHYVKQYIEHDLHDNKKVIDEEIAALKEEQKKRAIKVSEQYLKDNHGGKTLKELQPELKEKMREVTEQIATTTKNDEQMKAFDAQIAEKNSQLKLIEQTATEQLAKVNNIKDKFINTYYPQVKPVAKELVTAFDSLDKEEKAAKRTLDEGGNFSCLSFVPVKISEEGKEDKYECLVALSGAELESTTGVNPHQILHDFAQTYKVPGLEQFTFRYVDESAGYLNLALKQLGKGLSGNAKPLSSREHGEALPEFEKSCAEKRLTEELMKLYSSHGSQVQVLGCDNIALPLSKQASEKGQQAFKQREERRLKDIVEKLKKEEKRTPSKKSTKEAPVKEESVVATKSHEDTAREILKSENEKKAEFTFDASYPGLLPGESKSITLQAEHITCCTSCQTQKPAVMTFLYDSMKRGDAQRKALLDDMPKHTHTSTSTSTPTSCKSEVELKEGSSKRKSLSILS
ncbi:MAG: hypothetical protein BGO43_03175 [Gammaproteobacteria bacterium 39-13]|nr:hypothetical protein [Gammaproteobacteria bacterium]OJV87003.1 MAG: hypothetical protein BGO43_03175 [Gammaproteobacteria bacterium 39-13]